MKTESEFLAFYVSVLTAELENIDKLRSDARSKKIRITWILALVSIGVIASTVFAFSGIMVAIFLIYCGISFAYYKFESETEISDYEDAFKEKIIGGIIHFLEPDFEYRPDYFIPGMNFCTSDIYGQQCKGFIGSDYMEGYVGETKLILSKVEAIMFRETFRGLFMIIEFNKNFENETYVITKDSHSLKSDMEYKMHVARPPFIELDDPDFNYRYAVYGSNPVESRYLLTPAFMQKVLNYGDRIGTELNLSFVRGKLFVTISYPDSIFQPEYNSEPDKDTLISWFSVLNNAFDIVNAMGLNTRIWQTQDQYHEN
jgi:hypothetical protein